jgi:tight adherence protein B
LAVAVDVSERTGAALAETLQRFADGLRADLQAEQERESALAGPRATAMILAGLPLAGLGLGGLIGSHPWQTLLLTAPGRLCLLAGAGAWVTGRAWSAALIRRASQQP